MLFTGRIYLSVVNSMSNSQFNPESGAPMLPQTGASPSKDVPQHGVPVPPVNYAYAPVPQASPFMQAPQMQNPNSFMPFLRKVSLLLGFLLENEKLMFFCFLSNI